jgi:heme o synthase
MRRRSAPSARDYFALLKPRVMSLVVFTALVGMVRRRAGHHPVIGASSPSCASRSAPAPPARSTCGTTPTSTR